MEASRRWGWTGERTLGVRESTRMGEKSGESEGKRVTDCSLGPQTRAGSLPPPFRGLAPLKATLSIRPGSQRPGSY